MSTRRLAAALALLLAAGPAAAGEVELSSGYDRLTRDLPGWRTTTLAVTGVPVERLTLGAFAREAERWRLLDLELGASAGLSLGRVHLSAEGTASANHEFLPLWSAGGELAWAPGAGVVLSTGARLSRYRTDLGESHAGVARLGVERYLGPWRAGLTGYLSRVGGEYGLAGRLAVDRFYGGERSRVGIGLSTGRELESVGGAAPLVTRVDAVTLGGRHAIAGPWSVLYELGLHRQGDLYTRTGARLGLGRSF